MHTFSRFGQETQVECHPRDPRFRVTAAHGLRSGVCVQCIVAMLRTSPTTELYFETEYYNACALLLNKVGQYWCHGHCPEKFPQ